MREGRRFRGKGGGRAAGRRAAPARRMSSGVRRKEGGEGGREGERLANADGAWRGCGMGCCGRGMLWIGATGVLMLLNDNAVVVVGNFSISFPDSSSCTITSDFGIVFCFLLSAASCCFWSR